MAANLKNVKNIQIEFTDTFFLVSVFFYDGKKFETYKTQDVPQLLKSLGLDNILRIDENKSIPFEKL